MNNITLKLATEKDIPNYIEIEKSLSNLKIYSNMTEFEETKNEFKYNTVYMIENNNKVVGSIQYKIIKPDHIHISGLAVGLKYQHQGIGKEALTQILEKFKDIKKIDLVTHPENPVLNLYKSFGFVVGKRIENYFGDGEPRVELVKII